MFSSRPRNYVISSDYVSIYVTKTAYSLFGLHKIYAIWSAYPKCEEKLLENTMMYEG